MQYLDGVSLLISASRKLMLYELKSLSFLSVSAVKS